MQNSSERPVALLVGDPHLAPFAWSSRPDIQGDAAFALQEVLRIVEVLNPHAIFLLGDIFDSPRPLANDVSLLFQFADSLSQQGSAGPIYYLQGQHDRTLCHGRPTLPWPALHPGFSSADEAALEIEGVKFYGMHYRPAEELTEALSRMPEDTDVLLAHQVWQEHMPPGARCEASFASVPHVRMIASGDMHGHRSTLIQAQDGRTVTALSPGTLFMQSIDEDGEKFVYALYRDLTFVSVPLRSRPVLRFRIRSEEDLVRIVDQGKHYSLDSTLPVRLRKPIVQFQLALGLTKARHRLQAAWGGNAHLFYREQPQADAGATVEAPAEQEQADSSPAVSPGEILQGIVRRRLPDEYDAAVRLAGASDPEQEARQIVNLWRQEPAVD